MTNNDILRRVRSTFDLSDNELIEIFALADHTVTDVSGLLKSEGDDAFVELSGTELAMFLNGFINLKRGKRDGEQPQPEDHLSNNKVLQKLRIALNMKTEDILEVFQSVDVSLSKHELSAFFRKPENKHFRECKDEILQKFLSGLKHS